MLDPVVILEAVLDDDRRVVDFAYVEANDAAIAYYESTRGEIIGARFLEVLPEHADSGLLAAYVRSYETGKPLVLDDIAYLNGSEGSARYYDIRVVKIADSLACTWRDVTGYVESREEYRLLAEFASDIVYRSDPVGRIEWISPSVTEALGWEPEDLKGKFLGGISHPDEYATMADRAAQLDQLGGASFELRFRDVAGDYSWFSLAAHNVTDHDGVVTARIGSLRRIDAEVKYRESLVRSKDEFRVLAENSSDVVYRTGIDGVIQWVSPSMQTELGWRPDDLLGRPSDQLIANEDAAKLGTLLDFVCRDERKSAIEVRFKTSGGELRWMSVHAQAMRDSGGAVVGCVVGLSDCQSEVVARRAFRTLSAGSRVLVMAVHEEGLLAQMCEAAVDEGGYLLAWYGRKMYDERHSVAMVAVSQSHRDYLDGIEVTWGDGVLGRGPTGRAIRTGRSVVLQDFGSDSSYAPWKERASSYGFQSSLTLPVTINGEIDGAWCIYAPEPNAFDDIAVSTLADLAAELGYGLNRLREQERLVQSLRDQSLLSEAIEQAGESIVVTDPAASIVYANPAAARTSGYALEELIGANPRVLHSGLQDRAFYDEMWATLVAGRTWRGTISNKRKDGSLYEEDATISPIHDADGNLTAYVAVKRDLTTERHLEGSLSREMQDRNAVLEVMREVRRSETIQDTANDFCRAATKFDAIEVACLLLRQSDGELLPIGLSGTDMFDVYKAQSFRLDDPSYITRVADGPVLINVSPDAWSQNPEVYRATLEEGIRAIVLSPVRWEGRMVGILALATRQASTSMEMRFAHFEELGTYAGTLLGAQVVTFEENDALLRRVREIIDNRQFHPVFQAFVNLSTGAVVGYEALTRFDDGANPKDRFDDAQKVGLGSELEAACVVAAIKAAKTLPKDKFLSVNFSPASLLDGRAAAAIKGTKRGIVIEITEHAQIEIESYSAIREAVRQIKGCKLAVDDAGAGFTSLEHILELQPAYVKLDISIVHDIDKDPAREAMAAGMCHFAAKTGTIIIAEGIETEAEASTLREMGVSLAGVGLLGQGYLFGRPEILS
jgi:PAS domain S-box-containing protein